METRIFHGDISPDQIANALVAKFNRGNLVTQQLGRGAQVVVQIRTRRAPTSGGQTALTITLQEVEDGVTVQVGRQAWLGLAASLGISALQALHNPFSLIGRLDDVAQDIENLTLVEDVWKVVDEVARVRAASHEISERLRSLTCEYCRTANPVGEARCLACGAPLGDVQPQACPHCGFVVTANATRCPNCGRTLD